MNNYDIFLSINGKKIKGEVVEESTTSINGGVVFYTLSISFLNPKVETYHYSLINNTKFISDVVVESDIFKISFTEEEFKKIRGKND